MKKECFIEDLVMFLIFGAIYYVIETVWKYPNPSHWSMYAVGGIAGCLVGKLNNHISWDMPLRYQCFWGMIIITLCEGISGIILNKWLMLNIWDYSNVPLNFFEGQCCVPFCLAWYALSGVAIFVDDFLREWLFAEPRHKYVW